jgi:ABC-type transport system involved in cytochrome c biogenesis permease subunit
MSFRKWWLLLVVALVPAAASAGDRSGELDWSTWQHLPVFHNGRMMPLNTFAHMAVETITGRPNPRLAPPEGSGSEARELFPGGEPRKFTAAEILFSWLVEPKRWQEVPFLVAGHEDLRSEVLELPAKDEKGNHLKYVSPRQVQSRFMAIRMRLTDLRMKQQQAEAKGEKYKLSPVEAKLRELYDAYTLFQLLSFHPATSSDSHGRFMEQLNNVVETWNRAGGDIHGLSQADATNNAAQQVSTTEDSLQKLIDLAKNGEISLEKAEPLVVKLHNATSALAAQFAEHNRRLFKEPPADWDESQLKRVRTKVHALATMMDDMARQANEAHVSLYDSGHALRLVPALNPAALENNRDTGEDAQPWLSFQGLIHGSDDLLEGYPAGQVAQVREAFREASAAYVDRGASDRAERFSRSMGEFASAVRSLGESIEPVRRELPIQHRDEDLLAATAYPPAGATRAEVHYYQFSPFFWSWLVNLGALACFGLSFGVIRKPMFWLGVLVLIAAQLFTVYGFGLRVYITGWAPVTNMFETVMFVALVVAVLGIVFTLAPIIAPGLKNAWRLTAIPGTWEAEALSEDQERLMDPAWWNAISVAMLLPRAALACVVFMLLALTPYGAGEGYTVVSLLPRTDVGSSMPTVNDVTVWAVGMALLLASVWYLPRAILAGVGGLGMVPYTLAKLGAAKPVEHALARKPFALAGATVGFFAAILAYYAPVFDENINPLMPVLRDNFWLTLHVLTITASYGAGGLAWGLGNLALGYYLFGRYRDPVPVAVEGHRPAGEPTHAALTRHPPEAVHSLGGFIYKAMQVAVLLLAAGTILGGLWADVSWGRFWGWDSKEVWALVSLLIYLAVLHGRYAGWFGNFGLAVGSVVGATSILMAWYGVNFVLGSGLHTYGDGAGGLLPVAVTVTLNWLFIVPAAIRYLSETAPRVSPQPSAPANEQSRRKETANV